MARRVCGENTELTLGLRTNYGRVLCQDGGSTLNDIREAVTTLEETQRTARRVLGGSHPLVEKIASYLLAARTILATYKTPSPSA